MNYWIKSSLIPNLGVNFLFRSTVYSTQLFYVKVLLILKSVRLEDKQTIYIILTTGYLLCCIIFYTCHDWKVFWHSLSHRSFVQMMLLQIKTLFLNNVSTPSESDTHLPVASAGSSYLYLTILSCLGSLNSRKGQKAHFNFLTSILKKIQKWIWKLNIRLSVVYQMCIYMHFVVLEILFVQTRLRSP